MYFLHPSYHYQLFICSMHTLKGWLLLYVGQWICCSVHVFEGICVFVIIFVYLLSHKLHVTFLNVKTLNRWLTRVYTHGRCTPPNPERPPCAFFPNPSKRAVQSEALGQRAPSALGARGPSATSELRCQEGHHGLLPPLRPPGPPDAGRRQQQCQAERGWKSEGNLTHTSIQFDLCDVSTCSSRVLKCYNLAVIVFPPASELMFLSHGMKLPQRMLLSGLCALFSSWHFSSTTFWCDWTVLCISLKWLSCLSKKFLSSFYLSLSLFSFGHIRTSVRRPWAALCCAATNWTGMRSKTCSCASCISSRACQKVGQCALLDLVSCWYQQHSYS